jgi:mannose-6-phosphate isomerase-like protein (cupin superfamily)
MNRVVLSVCLLFALSQASTSTQGGQPPKIATDISAAEVQAVLNAPTGGGDRQMKVVDMGKYNVSVGVLHRGKTTAGAPVGAINHEHVTEVYYIISGSGTLLTGGTVDNAKPLPADGEIVKVAVGPSNQGTFRQAAQSRKVAPGDIVIIPAGVYHGFTDVADHVDYVSVRPDPDHVLPAGYVHPLLKK